MAKLQRRRPQPVIERPADVVRATDIRIVRDDVELETRSTIDPATGRMTGRSKGDRLVTPLMRALRHGDISQEQSDAGERFARLVETAEFVPFKSNLNREITGESPDTPVVTRANLRRASASKELDIVERVLGPVLLPVLYCVAVDSRPAYEWAQSVGKPSRHGMAALSLALDTLVLHWRDRRPGEE